MLLVETFRGAERESVHVVRGVHCDTAAKVLHETEPGAAGWELFLRSAAKPFQAAPAAAAGLLCQLGLEDRHLAIACASHNGSLSATVLVAEILEAAGLTEEALLTGSDGQGTPIQHQCSGNHAWALAWCAVRGLPTATYLDPSHPVQQAMSQAVDAAVGHPLRTARDNCGMPTHRVTLGGAATAFARLGCDDAERHVPGLGRVADAMRANPHIVRERGQIDAELMTADPDLVAKFGAEAVLGIGHRRLGGIAFRVLDGATRALGPAGCATTAEWFATVSTGLERPPLLDAHDRPIGHLEARWSDG